MNLHRWTFNKGPYSEPTCKSESLLEDATSPCEELLGQHEAQRFPESAQAGEQSSVRSSVQPRHQATESCPSFRSVLEELQLTRKADRAISAMSRDQLEKSELLEIMQRISNDINTRAGALVIDVQSYLPPSVRVRSFTFMRGNDKHVMQIEFVGTKTMVVFLTRKGKSVFSRFAVWIYGLFGAEKSAANIKLASVIRSDLTEEDVQKWFIYLLSGLKRAIMPSAPMPPSRGGKTGNRQPGPSTSKHSGGSPSPDGMDTKLHDSLYQAARYGVNGLLAVSILVSIYSIGWEYSTRRYLKGFSDAIIPASSSPEEKIEAILNWMAHSPVRQISRASSLLPKRDPTETLNYDGLLQVCGSATNAFINLADSSGLRARRLLLLDSHRLTKHVVAEVFDEGRWIVVDPAFRVIPRGTDGKPLTRAELADPAAFAAATRSIPGYDPSYTYDQTSHIRLARLGYAGLTLRKLLDDIAPGWEDSMTITLLVERESLAALVASILLVLFLIVLSASLGWVRGRWLSVQEARIRQQAFEVSFNSSE